MKISEDEKEVAEAIFECTTPVISAVGHETDWTIADMVADLRAPTPSAAAEIAVPEWTAIEQRIEEYAYRLKLKMEERLLFYRQMAARYQMQLKYVSPMNRMNDYRQRLMHMEEDMQYILKDRLKEERHRLAVYCERLSGLSPLRQLERGYAMVSDSDGKSINSVHHVNSGDRIHVRLMDGMIDAVVSEAQEALIEGSGEHGKK